MNQEPGKLSDTDTRGDSSVQASFQNDFLAAWLDDVGAGRTRSLTDYQAMFPGHEDEVEAELRLLTDDAEGSPAAPDLSSIHIPDVELIEKIGRGGQGVVYRGRQSYLKRDVAVKIMAPATWSESFARRFQREATTLASLRHPNIVSCYQAGTTDSGLAYIVMEFIDGPDLRAWLRENGPMPQDLALRVCRDLALALDEAQQSNIIHRDVKPENVLLQPLPHGDKLPFTAKLADLGLARVTAESIDNATRTQLTPIGTVMGSPLTMAPEQFDDPDGVDHRADIYGLGCILYHAISGQSAFQAQTMVGVIKEKIRSDVPDLRVVAPDVRPEVAEFVSTLLAPDVDDRPSTHAEVVATCARLCGETHAVRGRRVWVALAGAAAIVLSLVLTTPWSNDHTLSVKIAAPEDVVEGQTIKMRAVSSGADDLNYSWEQTGGPIVSLSDKASAEASFTVPRGIIDTSSLVFALSVKNGQYTAEDSWSMEIHEDPVHSELKPGEVLELFKPGLGKTLEDWFDSTGPGTWATADDDSGATGFCTGGTTLRSRYLPRGKWVLTGSMKGIEHFTKDQFERFNQAGLRLEFSCGTKIELTVNVDSTGESYTAGLMRINNKPNSTVERNPKILGTWAREQSMPVELVQFELEWDESTLHAKWRTTTAAEEFEFESKSSYSPSKLTIFVDGGHACFCDLSLKGM